MGILSCFPCLFFTSQGMVGQRDGGTFLTGERSFPSNFEREYYSIVCVWDWERGRSEVRADRWLNLLWHFPGDCIEKTKVWRRNM